MTARTGDDAEPVLDFAAWVNRVGPPDCVRPVIARNVERLTEPPDPDCTELVRAIASAHGVAEPTVVVAAGTEALLHAVECAVTGERLVVLDQPGDPAKLRARAAAEPDAMFVVDETFADLVDGYASVVPGQPANLVMLRSLSAFYALPGMPLAYAVADHGLAERIREQLPRGTVGRLAQAVGAAVLQDAGYVERVRSCIHESAGAATRPPRRHTPAIMFQGTSSNAGKSVLAAALCRILVQEGYRVAPFKAQNMSLNSFVTADGGEMGRAQVVQAQACRREPDVRMNPVLLKPTTDAGSQVIVMGQSVGNMKVADYVRYQAEALASVHAAYDSLAAEHDVIVLEGAGSPAEVNLKDQDIVNMRMAQYAHSPVLLVGDIDLGGVYASFVGTMEVMDEWQRRLVAGFVVNRFRGDASLLAPAHDYVERFCGRPVLGVIPYLHDLGLPEEDSVEFKAGTFDDSGATGEAVEIAVIDLPYISNFTDFDALRLEPDVRVRVVRTPADLGQPDAVVLPGSKSVICDLAHLRESGLARALSDLADGDRAEVVGVCAGLQMLGRSIADPHRIESAVEEADGLGLLPVRTVLAPDKTLRRVEATHVPSGLPVTGYEIHHGLTEAEGAQPVVRRGDGEVVGLAAPGRRVWGTYLHGIFDADRFRRWFVDRLRVRRGWEPLGEPVAHYDLEPALDRLADAVRAGLDVDAVLKVIGLP